MKNLKILIALTFFAATQVVAQDETVKPVQLSFVPYFGTNLSPGHNYYHLSVNMLAGYNGGVKGIEIGGLANLNKLDVIGLQASGLVNLVGQQVTGIQISGLTNLTKGNVKGIQLAGLASVNGESIAGFQASGLANVQFGPAAGFQASGLANVTTGTVKGAQISGVYNQSASTEGVQISGIANLTGTLKGVQIGLVNIADSVEKGATIGLLNIVRTGMHKVEVEYNDVMDVNLSFRSGTNQFYSILQAGIQPVENGLWMAAAGFGTQLNVSEKFYSGLEVLGGAINRLDGFEDEMNILNRVQLNIGYRISETLSVNMGPSLNIYVTDLYNADDGTYGLIHVKNPISESTNGDTHVKIWLGYRAAIRF